MPTISGCLEPGPDNTVRRRQPAIADHAGEADGICRTSRSADEIVQRPDQPPVTGYGVGTRSRSVSILPEASSADAFRPLPPMSIARVIGPVFALLFWAEVMTGD